MSEKCERCGKPLDVLGNHECTAQDSASGGTTAMSEKCPRCGHDLIMGQCPNRWCSMSPGFIGCEVFPREPGIEEIRRQLAAERAAHAETRARAEKAERERYAAIVEIGRMGRELGAVCADRDHWKARATARLVDLHSHELDETRAEVERLRGLIVAGEPYVTMHGLEHVRAQYQGIVIAQAAKENRK